MSISAKASRFDNPDHAKKQYELLLEKKQNDRKQAVENLGTKAWLEAKLEDRAQAYPVMGREFHFKPIGNKRAEEVMAIGASEASKMDTSDIEDLEDVDGDQLDDMPKFVRSMRETLEESCTDAYMADEGLGKLPLEELMQLFEDVAMGDGMANSQRERARKFRN